MLINKIYNLLFFLYSFHSNHVILNSNIIIFIISLLLNNIFYQSEEVINLLKKENRSNEDYEKLKLGLENL